MAELKLPFIGHGGDYNPDQWRDRPDILAEDIRLAVIHELWMANDASAMIMPGSFPLDIPTVKDELVTDFGV